MTADPAWQHFDHAADMGISAVGPSLSEAFSQAALGMTAIITREAIATDTAVDITCQAPNAELLLIDWLNALIFEMATRRLLFGRFEVEIEQDSNGLRLTSTAWGETVDRERHQPAVEIKGATYTALDVHRQPDGTWIARCVVDV